MVEIRNVTKEEIEKALMNTNQYFNDNVIFNRFERVGKNFQVTLKVKNSKEPGHRRGFAFDPFPNIVKGKRLASACWHVWGVFFDELIDINNNAIIISACGRNGKQKIDKTGGNWQERDVGSQMSPMYLSDLCDCYENEINIPSQRY